MLLKFRDLPPLRYWLKLPILCAIALYILFMLCLINNFYVLLSRVNTILYLRVYHLIVAGLMVACMFIMFDFLRRARSLPKLEEPHEIPAPALIGAITLSFGVAVGFFYLIVYNYAFQDCDKLVDVTFGSELYLDVIYLTIMILFTLFSLTYILQRRYYGSLNSNLDRINRLYINITFFIVWVKVVLYKSYMSQEELCQRREFHKFWCPFMRRDFDCEPEELLHGTQRIWFYLHKGLLNIAVMSCASEIYPVLLIAHWLACGNAELTAEHLIKVQKRGFRSIMKQFVDNISTVPAEADEKGPDLRISYLIKIGFILITFVTTVLMIINELVLLYYAMDYNNLWPQHWITSDAVKTIAVFFQMFLFIALYLWSKRLHLHRLDAHHKASARGDVIILLGCCFFLLIKCILQVIEDSFQYANNHYSDSEIVFRIFSRIFILITIWAQYLAVQKILAMSNKDARSTKHFLPFVAVSGCILGLLHFGSAFLETTIIHFQLEEIEYKFTRTTLMIMIFTQILYPADYLYGFTVASCWLEVVIRYLELGFFQVGKPRLEKPHENHHNLKRPTRLTSQQTERMSVSTLRYRPSSDSSYPNTVSPSSIDECNGCTSTSTSRPNQYNTQSSILPPSDY